MSAIASTSPKITVESPLPWLQIMPEQDSQFSGLFEKTAPPGSESVLATALPYSAVITNKGRVPIVSLAVRFLITTEGRTVTREFHYQTFPDVGRAVLMPEKSILMTPLRDFNDVAHGRRPNPRQQSALNVSQVLAHLASADHIHIAIDLVISPDGRMAGPDDGKIIDGIRSRLEAYLPFNGISD